MPFHSHTWYTVEVFIDYFREKFPGPYVVRAMGLGPLPHASYLAVVDDFGNLVRVRP